MAVTLPDGTVQYAGMVVRLGSREVRVMSDVWDMEQYAVVLDYNDAGDMIFRQVVLGTCDLTPREYRKLAEVDASPELMGMYERYTKVREERDRQVYEVERDIRYLQDNLASLKTLGRDKTVVVARGRKVPVGTTGVVFWIGPDQFKRGEVRLGLKDAMGVTHWTAGSNVDVVLDNDSQALYAKVEGQVAELQGRLTTLMLPLKVE